jgi:hypothetical protein
MFQCATDATGTVEEKEETPKINTPASIASGRNTAVGTTQSEKTENTETTDMIALARSAKRKIEAEFYARVFGSPTKGGTTPVSDHTSRTSFGAGGDQDRDPRTSFGVGGEQERDTLSSESSHLGFPQKIEMKKQQDFEMNEPPLFTAMFDASSGESSGDRKTDARGGGNKTDFGFIPMETAAMSNNGEDLPSGLRQNVPPPNNEPPKELDDLLGPFVPFAPFVPFGNSRSHVTGASHRTRKKSNAKRVTEESRDFIIHHHPDQGPSAYGEVGRNRSPPRNRSTGSVPELVIGAQGSADESEVTMDRRQFAKRPDADNYFWQFMVNPTSSTLTRSVT